MLILSEPVPCLPADRAMLTLSGHVYTGGMMVDRKCSFVIMKRLYLHTHNAGMPIPHDIL